MPNTSADDKRTVRKHFIMNNDSAGIVLRIEKMCTF